MWLCCENCNTRSKFGNRETYTRSYNSRLKYICNSLPNGIFLPVFVDYKSDQMIGGQISRDIIRLSVTKDGLVGGLVNTLFGSANDAVCTVLGPKFLQLLLDECKNCPGFARSQNNIESHEEFCELYNLLPADAQECVTDGAIRIKGPSIMEENH